MKNKILFCLCFLCVYSYSHATSWYVNAAIGDDAFDGLSLNTAPGNIGPKRSISNAITVANPGDTIYVAEGVYPEALLIDKALVIRGNNWGTNPINQTRNPESVLVPPVLMTANDISGNSLIEIKSCCISLDGLMLYGDNANLNSPNTKYGKQYEVSYGIGGNGNYNNLYFTNLIISNFYSAGIQLSSSSFSTQSNKIDFCKIHCGDQNSEGIRLYTNFYSDLTHLDIDSTFIGVSLINFSSKNNVKASISNNQVRSEETGLLFSDFNGNTDVIVLENNQCRPLDLNTAFTGIQLIDLVGTGEIDLQNNILTNCKRGIFIQNNFNTFNLIFLDNTFNGGAIGLAIDQSSITNDIALTIQNSDFTNLDSSAIYAYSEGDLISVELVDVHIQNSANGIFLLGNSTLDPSNTQFDAIKRYYIYMDSSLNGIKPGNKVEATSCTFEGVLGNSLNVLQGFKVEDKIRHFLDRNLMGWVLFSNTNLYVSNYDGNSAINAAIKIASNGWNIFANNLSTSEYVIVSKTINLYTQTETSIGKLTMLGSNRFLYLHGKLILTEGLQMQDGIIETTDTDTLIIYRNNYNTSLNGGNTLSYINGPFYMRYINMPEDYVIVDSLPCGLGDDYRPIIINATWPNGLFLFDMGVKSFSGKAPLLNLPADISHISDVRYWQLTNPFNSRTFNFNSIGFAFSELKSNDYVNDSNHLRVVYNDYSNSYNLGGLANANKNGIIQSNNGTPGIGYYTLGNEKTGNNTLSANFPVALITVNGNCSNDSITFSALGSRSEVPLAFWNWQITGPSSVSTPEIQETIRKKISVPGTYQVRLIVTNNNAIDDTTQLEFIVKPIPQIAYSATAPCFPKNIDLKNASVIPPNTSIVENKWVINGNTFTGSDVSFTPINSGNQSGYLKVTLDNGCKDSLPISFESPQTPQIKLIPNGNVSICPGDSVLIKVTKNGNVVQWNDNGSYDSLYIKTNSFKKATIYNSLNCFVSDSVLVTIMSNPEVSAGKDLETTPGKPITLLGKTTEMVEWIPETWLNDATILNPVSRPLVSTKYILRAYNTQGCESFDTMWVKVISNEDLSIPNLLTPDGDGHNDTWKISSISDPQNCKVSVFTREGFLVYSVNSYGNDWNGTHENQPLPDGYYVFVIEHALTNKVYTGILNIIR